jgi:hypothetical protein
MPRRRHFRRTWLRIYSLWSLLFRSIRKCGDFIARHYLTLADSGAGLRRALWLLRGPLLVVTIFVAMLQTDQLKEVLWIHAADLYDAPYRPLLGWSASILYFFVCNACAGVLPHPTALSRPGPYGFSTRRHLSVGSFWDCLWRPWSAYPFRTGMRRSPTKCSSRRAFLKSRTFKRYYACSQRGTPLRRFFSI